MSTSPTIRDVAREAGVAIGTVSRVLSNSPTVRDRTRIRVIEVIQRLGYRPSSTARQLARGKTETFGVLVPDLNDHYVRDVLGGIQAEACDADHSILVMDADRPARVRSHLLSLSEKLRVDGLIVVRLEEELVNSALGTAPRFPVVGIDTSLSGAFNLGSDDKAGMYFSARHLIGHGHSRIALVDRPQGRYGSPMRSERRAGFMLACDESSLGIDSALLEIGDDSVNGGYASTQRLLLLENPPTAIACASDIQAIGAMRAIAESGRVVGRHIAVAGYQDVDIAQFACLTTVQVPTAEIGRMAVRQLMSPASAVAGETDGRTFKLTPRLIVRASCGCEAESRLFGWPGFFPDFPLQKD